MPFDPISPGAARGLFGGAKSVWSYFKNRYWPPKIGYQLAPSNLLEVVRPYVNRDKVLELLGQPHSRRNNPDGEQIASYRFEDALLQLAYDKDGDVESVTLAALNLRWPHRFKIHPLGLVLGGSTLFDASNAEAAEMLHNGSSKFTTFWIARHFGFSGSYNNFYFALLSAATYPPLDWGHERVFPAHINDRWFLSSTDKIKFNAVAISRNEEEFFPFMWESFQ